MRLRQLEAERERLEREILEQEAAQSPCKGHLLIAVIAD
jgi:hypothetical protein